MITKTLGKSIIIEVNGFTDARLWIERCVRSGIVKCAGGNCWHAATHVFWQDRAEWYPLCENHRENGQQWSGSTSWDPSEFSLAVLPDKVDSWLESLNLEEHKAVQLKEYDATNWYSLITDDVPNHHYILGDEKQGGWRANIHKLKAGGYCYELEQVSGTFHTRYFSSYGFFGDFETSEACIADARERQPKQ